MVICMHAVYLISRAVYLWHTKRYMHGGAGCVRCACYFSFSGKRMVERARDWMGGYGLCLCIKCKPKC